MAAEIKEIDWDALPLAEARELMLALREGQRRGEEWFGGLQEAFTSRGALTTAGAREVVSTSYPASAASAIPQTTVTPSVSRPRGRPRKQPEAGPVAHPPLAVSGSEVPDGRRVPLMPNLVTSREGPPAGMSTELPPGHPRATGEWTKAVQSAEAADVREAEAAVASGRVQDLFQ